MRVPGIPYVQGRNAYADRDSKKYAIAIHNTSNNASDENEASYATRRTDDVSSHFYCDKDSVIQSLDTNSRAGHAGNYNGNENAVAVEITGGNGLSRQWWIDNVAWDKLGSVLATVCKAYGIAVRRASVSEMQRNPTVKAFYGHDDMRRAWGGTDHTDPGPNFPWDRLFQAVNAHFSSQGVSMATAEQMSNLLNEGWAILTGNDAGIIPNEQPGAKSLNVGNPLWTKLKDIEAAVKARPTVEVDADALATALATNANFIDAVATMIVTKLQGTVTLSGAINFADEPNS